MTLFSQVSYQALLALDLDLVLNALWHYRTVLLSVGLGIEWPLALPYSPLTARYTTVPFFTNITWVCGIECPKALL